ncbi:hypothetical protein ACFL2E_04305 [Thermodesulfobacteriota bacterium]
MKKLFIILFSVLMVAGFVYAAEEEEEGTVFDFSGMINTRGSYLDNDTGELEDAGDYMYYDMEFDGTLKITPTDQTLIYLNWEIHDENYTVSPDAAPGAPNDDNIYFKRAYGSYDFSQGTSLDFGLMTGGAWATAFGDNADGYYRVKAVHKADFGVLVGLVEKDAEVGPGATGDYEAEKDDNDMYALALITKAGDITIMPLLKYATVGTVEADEETDLTVMALDLGATGSFGAIGFEAEFVYADFSYDTDFDAEDYNLMGAYVNVWTSMDALKIGGMIGYGSWDDDAGKGFGFGEDFGPGYWVMDWEHFGSSGKAEYYAATLIAVYGSYAVNDALSLNGALEYMMSNEEDTEWEEATGTIVSAGLSYKLADNVTYAVGGAYGQFKGDDFTWDDDDDVTTPEVENDPDAFARVYHKITISF